MSRTHSPVLSRLFALTLVVAFFHSGDARAEQLGLELISMSLSTAAAQPEDLMPLDEIIVFGTREKHELPEQSTVGALLLERILRDFALHEEMQKELEWRVEAAKLDTRRPRLRLGYDVREQAREPAFSAQTLLPLDLVMPATVLSVDF